MMDGPPMMSPPLSQSGGPHGIPSPVTSSASGPLPSLGPPGSISNGGPGGPPPPGQRNMSDYINAAIRSIEQSIDTRDPNAPGLPGGPLPPPGHPGGPPPGPFMGTPGFMGPPGMPPHSTPGLPHPGMFPYDGPYHGGPPEMVQFDETNPHHPAFFDRMEAPGFNPHSFGGHEVDHGLHESAPGHVTPPGGIPPQFSGNEHRPFDQSGPSFTTGPPHGFPLPHFVHPSQHEAHIAESPQAQPLEKLDSPAKQSEQSQQASSTTNRPGAPTILAAPAVPPNSRGSKLSFNNSPDSVSRCSISPRDSGYDT